LFEREKTYAEKQINEILASILDDVVKKPSG